MPHRWQYQGGRQPDEFVDELMRASQMKTRRAWRPRRVVLSDADVFAAFTRRVKRRDDASRK
jgi:hypothetical protein